MNLKRNTEKKIIKSMSINFRILFCPWGKICCRKARSFKHYWYGMSDVYEQVALDGDALVIA